MNGIVRISNISDFIEPSQKCILPLQNDNKANRSVQNQVGIHSKNSIKPEQKVKVTLSDCLACSGCITTAETMLVESQTIDQMIKGFSEHELSVVTVSPQSLSSLAVHFNESPEESAKRLTRFLKFHGVRFVIDSSFARLISRRLLYEEFVRERQKSDNKRKVMITGVCPGFVCYAEKTHSDLLVPLISRVKSPQAISGVLVKDFLRRKLSMEGAFKIFHACVMPCYDKKLEASRKDFLMEGVNDVDCVVTASELVSFLSSFSDDDEDFVSCSSSCKEKGISWLNRFEIGQIIGNNNRESSGGYADYIVNQLSALPNTRIERNQRNKDLEEIKIILNEMEKPVIIAKLYGFRNIQNAVQKLKRDKLSLDFIELMACPSGCSNGGGQIRAESTEERQRISNAVNDAYSQLYYDETKLLAEVDNLFVEWSHLNPNYYSTLFTDYHSLSDNNNLAKMTLEAW